MVPHRDVYPTAKGKSKCVAGGRFAKGTNHRDATLLKSIAVEIRVCCTDQKVAIRLHKMRAKFYLWSEEVGE